MAFVSVLFSGDTTDERTLDRERLTIGRAATCDIVIDNLGISRVHCTLLARGSDWWIEDASTTNGTFVNRQKVDAHRLADGDVVTLGKYQVVFHAVGEASKTRQIKLRAMGGEMTFVMAPNSTPAQTTKPTERVDRSKPSSAAYALPMALSVIRGSHVTRIPLLNNTHHLGAGADADIPTPGFLVKPIQAVITALPQGGHTLEPKTGWRAVYINGVAVTASVRLKRGDTIRIAGRELSYVPA